MSEVVGFYVVAVLAGGVRAGVPILYAALGEVFAERGGVINLGIEGIMLLAALVAVVVDYHLGSATLAVLAAMSVGAVVALGFGGLTVFGRANQIAAGIALILLGTGLSAFAGSGYVGKKVAGVSGFDFPALARIPVIGPVFFRHDVLVYLLYLLVPLGWWLMYRTRWGLWVRAVGEDPEAAAHAGVNVRGVRLSAVVLGGALAGVGGAYLSLAYTQLWVEGMVAGRGLIAVVLAVFASWDPVRAAFGAWLFGGIGALQLRLQASGVGVSPYLLAMLPYLLTIVAMVYASARARRLEAGVPRALGKAYVEVR